MCSDVFLSKSYILAVYSAVAVEGISEEEYATKLVRFVEFTFPLFIMTALVCASIE